MTIVKSQVLRLILKNFRNYHHLNFAPSADFLVITGDNGIGKTNVLESISLLAPGKGLRGVKLEEINNLGTRAPWSVTADVYGQHGVSRIFTCASSDHDSTKRVVKIDDHNSSQVDLARTISVSWLVPQMCHIFTDTASSRRKFLDRMVANFDSTHVKNLHAYEYHVKERSNLLKNPSHDKDWLKIIERNIAQVAVMIATARIQFVSLMEEAVKCTKYDLPKFSMKASGFLEDMIYKIPSLQIEEEFCEALKGNREIDFLTKRTNAGIHRSDLLVYGQGDTRADMCSTGEQKFLLMSIFLTEIIAQVRYKNRLPIILLDDVSAHLDLNSQARFFEIVSDIQAQVWVTSISMERFSFLEGKAEFLKINDDNLVVG